MHLRDIDYIPMMEMVKDDKIKETYILPDFSKIDEEASFFRHLKELSSSLEKFIYGIYYNDRLVGFINEVEKNEREIELGYFISPKYSCSGFATEALGIAIDHLFEMGYSMVYASCFEENTLPLLNPLTKVFLFCIKLSFIISKNNFSFATFTLGSFNILNFITAESTSGLGIKLVLGTFKTISGSV